MKELANILELWSEAEARGEMGILATVVKTRGSSYRLPGARLLMTQRGARAGSVSGGCLEDDLVKKAWWLTESGPVVRRYDTTPDGEIATGYGLGCNGIIHILLERLYPGRPNVLGLIRDVRLHRKLAAFACVLSPAELAGQSLSIDVAGELQNGATAFQGPDSVPAQMRTALEQKTSRLVDVEGDEVFIETLAPPVRLLVFGAGDDAKPLTTLAKFLGWQVIVSDGRSHYARRERFPHADEVVVRGPGAPVLMNPVDDWTVAVLMSHSYSQDLEVLRELADKPLRYLGVLGPRNRTMQLLSDARLDSSIVLSELHGPMGLDIGADGPEQVALSVISEIQATLNGRTGGMLRERRGSIHAPEHAVQDPERAWAQSIVCA